MVDGKGALGCLGWVAGLHRGRGLVGGIVATHVGKGGGLQLSLPAAPFAVLEQDVWSKLTNDWIISKMIEPFRKMTAPRQMVQLL